MTEIAGAADADRFVDLACLTYRPDESRARRTDAMALPTPAPNIHVAAVIGDIDALRAFIARDPDSVHRRGTSRDWVPLLSLCYSRVPQRDPLACLDLLLEHGADPNAHVMLDVCRFTALTGVIGEGEAGPIDQPPHPNARAMAERLLDAGASPADSQALYNTHFLPSNAWLELLLSRGLSTELDFLLGQAAIQGFVERVQLLLSHGASPEGRNHYNRRPHLENALLEGHADIAALLQAAGAPMPNFGDSDRFRVAVLANDAAEAQRLLPASSSNTDVLAAAARHNRVDALELGLSLGLPIDGRDAGGLTALHHAARSGHLEAVRLLVERGASLDVRDPVYGGTPLGHARHFAARWPRPHGNAIVALLDSRPLAHT